MTAAIAAPVSAQGKPLSIPRVDSRPTIDGTLQTGEWSNAVQVALTIETTPGENIAPPVKTDVFLMENGKTLFVAFIAHDPNTSNIRAYYRDHDQTDGHDIVGVVLDTFNDERQAFEFFSNPLGVQRDGINDDINKRYNSAWNGLWESGGKINGSNYTVEMAIPLSQLRFTANDDPQTWGVDLLRFYPRDKNHRLSHVPLDRNISCYLCQLKKAQGFTGVSSGRNLILTPTMTTDITEVREDPLVENWHQEDTDIELGLDLRWGINQNTYLNATIKPDFSQVEADDPQIDVNKTFSLFFEERRTFFLDGADYFNSRLDVVHTRKIVDPDYGAKITGKSGAHTYGLLMARDAETNFIIPDNQGSEVASLDPSLSNTESDVTIARYRYDIGETYTLGTIATDRRGENYSNTLFGIDGVFQLTDTDRLEFQGLQSQSEYPLHIQTDFKQHAKLNDRAYTALYQHFDRRWRLFARYDDYGRDFRADLGHFTRSNYIKQEVRGRHIWNLQDFAYNRIFVGGNWDKSQDQNGRQLEEKTSIYFLLEDGPKQSAMEFGAGKRNRFFDGLYFDESFKFFATQVYPASGLKLFFRIKADDDIDFANTRAGKSQSYEAEISYQFGRHLNAELNYDHQRFTVDEGLLFTATVTDLRMTYQFNNRSFLRLTTQFSHTDRNISLYNNLDSFNATNKNVATQLLYSYKLNAQSRFFVGYSEAGFQDDLLSGIKKTNRTLFLKASYAWQP